MYNGQDTFINPSRSIHQQKQLSTNWCRPSRNSYTQYKQQKMNLLPPQYHQPQINQIFINPNSDTINPHTNKKNTPNFFSGTQPINMALYESQFPRNYRPHYRQSGKRQKNMQITSMNRSSYNSSSPYLLNKGNTSFEYQKIRNQKQNCQHSIKPGISTIKSGSIRKKNSIQSNIHEGQYSSINDRYRGRQQSKNKIVDDTQNQQQSRQGDLLMNYMQKYNKYIKNEDIQQVIKCSQQSKYDINYQPQVNYRQPQSITNQKQKYNYSSKQRAMSRQQRIIPRQKQINYKHGQSHDFSSPPPQIIRYKQNTSSLSQYNTTHLDQNITKQKYKKQPHNTSTRALDIYYEQPKQKKSSLSIPLKSKQPLDHDKKQQQDTPTTKRDQLISKSNILRQKLNQLSADKNGNLSKNGKQSVNSSYNSLQKQKIDTFDIKNDRYYKQSSLNTTTNNLKISYGDFPQNNKTKYSSTAIKLPPKLTDITSKDLNNKQAKDLKFPAKQNNLLTPQQRQQRNLYSSYDNDSMNRINALNNKINEKINSIIMAYGR